MRRFGCRRRRRSANEFDERNRYVSSDFGRARTEWPAVGLFAGKRYGTLRVRVRAESGRKIEGNVRYLIRDIFRRRVFKFVCRLVLEETSTLEEFWYDLVLAAEPPKVRRLARMQAELGKSYLLSVQLDNPLNELLVLTCRCSNMKNFSIHAKDGKVIRNNICTSR